MKNGYLVACSALALLASGSVFAQSVLQGDINVSATVVASCTDLTVADVDFGEDGQVDATQDEVNTISVTCDSGIPYDVEIDYGFNPGGAYDRQVIGDTSAQFMDYEIFQPDATDPTGATAGTAESWGLKIDNKEYVNTGTGAAQPLAATFRLERTAGSQAGLYTDLVTVFLNF